MPTLAIFFTLLSFMLIPLKIEVQLGREATRVATNIYG